MNPEIPLPPDSSADPATGMPVVSLVLQLLILLFGGMGLVLLLVLGRDVLRRMSGSGAIYLIGLVALFGGERVMGESTWRWPVDGVAALIIVSALALRFYAWGRSNGERRGAHTLAIGFMGLSVAGLPLYALSLGGTTAAMGLGEDAANNAHVVLGALAPLLTFIGLVPMLLLDGVLSMHPVMLPVGAARAAINTGLAGAFTVGLLFPLNHIAATHSKEWDLAYFRTTRPGEATLKTVQTLANPVHAVLFYEDASDVKEELVPYFKELADASGGKLTFEVVDQPQNPALAEELKIRENGHIALKFGEVTEKIKIATDLKKARRDLKKLDKTVQKSLIKLSRGKRLAYLTAGHGEASVRESENLGRKLNVFKTIAGEQQLDVKSFGLTDGSTDAIPEDAAMVIVAAPTSAFMPEEIAAISKYLDRGGSLFVMADYKGDAMAPLLDLIGVKASDKPLANATQYQRLGGGIADRLNIVTNRFGSHDSVHSLSRRSSEVGVLFPLVVPLEKVEGAPGKRTTILRSMPETWQELGNNVQHDPEETKKVWDIGLAVEGPSEKPYRALVIGDLTAFADPIITPVPSNRAMLEDMLKWLSKDEDIAGDTNTEEDLKIEHRAEEDAALFFVSVVAVPLLWLALGAIVITLRRKSR